MTYSVSKLNEGSLTWKINQLSQECEDFSLHDAYEALSDYEKGSVRVAWHRNKKYEERRNKSPFEMFIDHGVEPPTLKPWKMQLELFDFCESHDKVLINVPREHGKTYFIRYYIEYLMEVKRKNVVHLSWSDIGKLTALSVYTYFYNKQKLTNRKGVINTHNHFRSNKDVSFDLYSTKDRKVLGFHDLVLIVDDPIDITFKTNPAKERELELVWSFTMENINPEKLIIVGTRKFEGDFYDFLMNMYGEDLAIYCKTPYLEDGTLLCPEKWTREKLDKKHKTLGEYAWSAEYMQDPHPIEGGMWNEEDIQYIKSLYHWKDYDYCVISLDPAITAREDSDLTGFVIVFRVKNKHIYHVYKDLSDRLEFDDILKKTVIQYEETKYNYPEVGLDAVIEKNAHGEYLIQHAKNKGLSFAAHIVPVHHSRDKDARIISALGTPIKNGSILFMSSLERSELLYEILTYPNVKHDDAIDALAMAITELEGKPIFKNKWVFNW